MHRVIWDSFERCRGTWLRYDKGLIIGLVEKAGVTPDRPRSETSEEATMYTTCRALTRGLEARGFESDVSRPSVARRV
jgi:hypothetical protein